MNQLNLILVGLIIFLIYYIFTNHYKNYKSDNINYESKYNELKIELENKINLLNDKLKEQGKNISNDELKVIIKQQVQPSDNIDNRDFKVIEDKLYPLLNRTERPIADSIYNNPYFNYPTRWNQDNFRAMAIVRNIQNNDVYYLMGRQKYSGSNQGEFYLISPDRDKGLKIPLSSDPSDRVIKDYYSLPDEITIKSGVFQGMTFKVQELKNSDLSSKYF